jgi:CHRD domain
MRARVSGLVVVAALAALATGLTLSVTVGAQGERRAAPKQKGLSADLSGAEVPGSGDPDGRGRARVQVLPRYRAVCFILRWRNIATPTGAHVHRGARGETGPHAVDLFPPGPVRHRGCVDGLERSLLRELARHPERFYVNVHTHDFHDGAIRGQLERTRRRMRAR